MNRNLGFLLALAFAVVTVPPSVALAGQAPPDRAAVLAQLKQVMKEAGGNVSFVDPEKSYAVSPDGRYFAGGLKVRDGTMSVVVDLAQKRTLWSDDGMPLESPVFSASSRWVAFGPPAREANVPIAAVVDLASGQLSFAGVNLAAEQLDPPRWRDATTIEFSFRAKEGGPGHCVWQVDQGAGRCDVGMLIGRPDPETRIKADEAAAVAFLRTVNTAAVTYSATYNVGYPKSLAVMGVDGEVTQDHAGLIDKTLASGKKSGYIITYRAGPVVDGRIDTYTAIARPMQYGKTGKRAFFTDMSGVIRFTEEDREPTVDDPPVG